MKGFFVLMLAVLLNVSSGLAGINDVLEKQKTKEQEEINAQQFGKAKHDRFLEMFNVVAGIVEELQKKGIKFKTWQSKYLSDYEVANEFRKAGWNVNVPVKDIRRYHKDKKTAVLAGGPAPLLASKLNDKVILFGSYMTKEREYIAFGTPDTLVMIDNGGEGEDALMHMMTENTKNRPIPYLYFGDSFKNRRDEIRDDILKLLGGLVFAYEATPQELKEEIAKGSQGLIMLDVRENDEVAYCRIPKSVHIPLAEVSARVKELDPEKEIVVYCAAGVRSARASKILDSAGFKKVRNMKGGLRNWMASGGVVEGPCK